VPAAVVVDAGKFVAVCGKEELPAHNIALQTCMTSAIFILPGLVDTHVQS